MAYDLAISSHGDLIMSGNRDLAGVSGSDLLDQRIKLRLIVHRGTWYYDTYGTLGSNLYKVLGVAPQAALEIEAYVREALRSMEEISIENIEALYNEDLKAIVVRIEYTQTPLIEEADLNIPGGAFQQTTVTVPYTPEGA